MLKLILCPQNLRAILFFLFGLFNIDVLAERVLPVPKGWYYNGKFSYEDACNLDHYTYEYIAKTEDEMRNFASQMLSKKQQENSNCQWESLHLSKEHGHAPQSFPGHYEDWEKIINQNSFTSKEYQWYSNCRNKKDVIVKILN